MFAQLSLGWICAGFSSTSEWLCFESRDFVPVNARGLISTESSRLGHVRLRREISFLFSPGLLLSAPRHDSWQPTARC